MPVIKFRETASTHVDAPVRSVFQMLRDPDTLATLQPRGTHAHPVGEDEMEVEGTVDGVHVEGRRRVVPREDEHRIDLEPADDAGGRHAAWYVLQEEDDGTRLVHGMWIEPGTLLEELKARVGYSNLREHLEDDLDRLKQVVEDVDPADV